MYQLRAYTDEFRLGTYPFVLFCIHHCGKQDFATPQVMPQQLNFIGGIGERQGHLPAVYRRAAECHHDLKTGVRAVEIARMHFAIVVQPVGDVLDVRRHIEIVVHAAATRNCNGLGDGTPTTAGQDLREPVGALRADTTLPPPIIDLGHVGSTRTALDDSSHVVHELN
jgi:hypothetical protein